MRGRMVACAILGGDSFLSIHGLLNAIQNVVIGWRAIVEECLDSLSVDFDTTR